MSSLIWSKLCFANEDDQCFISDQMCSSRWVKNYFLPTGLKAYLQYCKCCIYCFVIQLLSEPDKLNCCSLFQVGFRHATLLAFSGLIPSLIVLAQYLKQYSQYSKLSLSNYSIMRCICKMRDALVKEKTLLDWLDFLLISIFW